MKHVCRLFLLIVLSDNAIPGNRRVIRLNRAGPIIPPVNELPPDAGQVRNEAQGYSYVVKKLERVKRYIVLGTEGGTYYATEKEGREDNVKCVLALLKENNHVDGLLNMLEQYSKEGRATKEDALLTALMTCVMYDDKNIQKKAYEKVVSICNIPTKLFRFIELCQQHIKKHPRPKIVQPVSKAVSQQRSKKRKNEPVETSDLVIEEAPNKKKPKKKVVKTGRSTGWGRMRRTSISAFYTDSNKCPERLLYLLTKYKNRHNWSHKQVLGYAHPKFAKDDDDKITKELILCYVTRGYATFHKRLKEKASEGDQQISRIVEHIDTLEKIRALNPKKEGDIDILLEYIRTGGVRDTDESDSFQMAVPGQSAIAAAPMADSGKKQIIRKEPFQLVREHIPNGFLKNEKVRIFIFAY